MFERKQKQKQKMDGLISNATDIVGDVKFKGGQHIDGHVKGNVTADNDPDSVLIIGETAVVEGNLYATTIIINGRVNGNIVGNIVEIEQSARVVGNITYSKFVSHAGAYIKGSLIPTEIEEGSQVFSEDNQ